MDIKLNRCIYIYLNIIFIKLHKQQQEHVTNKMRGVNNFLFNSIKYFIFIRVIEDILYGFSNASFMFCISMTETAKDYDTSLAFFRYLLFYSFAYLLISSIENRKNDDSDWYTKLIYQISIKNFPEWYLIILIQGISYFFTIYNLFLILINDKIILLHMYQQSVESIFIHLCNKQ